MFYVYINIYKKATPSFANLLFKKNIYYKKPCIRVKLEYIHDSRTLYRAPGDKIFDNNINQYLYIIDSQ